ncbi:CmpA/NrtA family ABC transporter substrate-binding protein [Methylocapsa aurea]|uniref:CmpA/NrtA family ABC transporter substrate-binding protein n=1 Tax=Methylocapsa aurea TaxID=663610 RepID=UPI00056CD0A8|nr:CmpA/NrtA family ABC transporter substrate-binding protein [Methylocapsa aurea]
MTMKLRIGYVPLTDAALLHVAKAQGFAAARGLELDLVRETSWANIRDRLALGHFDAAHMLAPAAIASSIGVGQMQTQLVAPVALGLNGNAITVSRALFDSLQRSAEGDLADPRVTAKALAGIARKRKEKGEAALTFGHVFPFSSHHYQLRLWMRAGGLDPENDVRLIVTPPPFMVETLREGHVDGFCVGAPWNSLAVAAGVGTILHSGTAIVRNCPEKVLAFRAEWVLERPAEASALAHAIGEASQWASEPSNRTALVVLLASVSEPGVSAETIDQILESQPPEHQAPPRVSAATATGLRLDPAAIAAHRSHALWLFAQMAAAGQVAYSQVLAATAAAVYQPILGPAIAGPIDAPLVFDGPEFTPDDLPSYLKAMGIAPRG